MKTIIAPVLRVLAKCESEDRGYITPCLVFKGSKNADGYGLVMTGSRTDGTRRVRRTHTVAWEAVHGEVPEGLELDHLCEVRACCNVEHIEARTHQENCSHADYSHNALPRPWQVGHPRYRYAGAAARVALEVSL